MPTTYLQSRLPSFNAGSKVGVLVLRATNSANPQTVVNVGTYFTPTLSCTKTSYSPQYNYEILMNFSTGTLYHLQTTGTNYCQLLTQGIKAIGDIRFDSNAVDGDTIVVNSGSIGQTYRFKDTLAAVNDVKIGNSGTNTASNFTKAIMLSGVAGTNYFAGTTAHPIFTAVANGRVVVLTDKIGCLRANGYTLTASAEGVRVSTRPPSGGVDGVLLAETNATTLQFRDVETYIPKKSSIAPVVSDFSHAPLFTLELFAELTQNHNTLYFGVTEGATYGSCVISTSVDNVTYTNIDVVTVDPIPYAYPLPITSAKYLKIVFMYLAEDDADLQLLRKLSAYIIST